MKNVLMMLLALTAVSQSALSQELKSGQVTCVLTDKESRVAKTEEIFTQKNGKGGVVSLQLKLNNVTCNSQAIAKFENKNIYKISLTFPNGEVIATQSNTARSAVLTAGEISCHCSVK
jgi:hypothetical protein